MITTLFSIAAFAALFALYGVLRPRAQCGPQCSACKTPCQRRLEGKHV